MGVTSSLASEPASSRTTPPSLDHPSISVSIYHITDCGWVTWGPTLGAAMQHTPCPPPLCPQRGPTLTRWRGSPGVSPVPPAEVQEFVVEEDACAW